MALSQNSRSKWNDPVMAIGGNETARNGERMRTLFEFGGKRNDSLALTLR